MNQERRLKLATIAEQLETLQFQIPEHWEEEVVAYNHLPRALQDSERGKDMQEAINAMRNAYNAVENAVDALKTSCRPRRPKYDPASSRNKRDGRLLQGVRDVHLL